MRVATADFNGDGTPDIVVGTGPGAPTQVRIIDPVTRQELFNINPLKPPSPVESTSPRATSMATAVRATT
ncbi:hypothetical protein HC761_02270 [bacterium]|nr:hypothetical protein [bacterium]